jgi:peroxiredoxin
VQPGEPAPDFTLAAVNREGSVSLAEYRGRSPVLVALFLGVFCPFCRRAIAQLATTRDKLQAVGVETLAVVATSPENARRYFQYRPAKVVVAADPELATHRAYGLPKVELTPAILQTLETVKVNPFGDLPEPMPLIQAAEALGRLDRFEPSDADQGDYERQAGQLKGQFLVDRAGVVRWANVECRRDGLAGFGKFPADDELVEAARAVAS